MKTILYPLKIDREGNPISTIHKAVGIRLPSAIHVLSFKQNKNTKLKNFTLLKTSKNIYLDSIITNIKSIFYAKNIDVLHLTPNAALYPLALFYKIIDKKIIYTVHESIEETKQRNFFVRNILKRFIFMADYRISVSKFVSDSIKKNYGLDSTVIYNGVDTKAFNPKNRDRSGIAKVLNFKHTKRKVVLFIGTLIKRKGSDIVAKISADYPNVYFVIIGKGPLEDVILKQVNKNKNLIFFKFLPQSIVSALYATSDVFLFPSILESFGLVYVESMASGTPILAYDSGAAKEIVTSNEGVLVHNERAMKIKLNEFLNGKIKYNRRRLYNSAKKRFGWNLVSKKYEDFYMKIIDNKKYE